MTPTDPEYWAALPSIVPLYIFKKLLLALSYYYPPILLSFFFVQNKKNLSKKIVPKKEGFSLEMDFVTKQNNLNFGIIANNNVINILTDILEARY